MRRIFPLVVFLLLLALPAWALGQTRALLVACRDFLTLPDLGNSVSGNLHIVGSALVGAGLNLGSLSIEDGTIGTVRHLQSAVNNTFGDADETDLSILYLCTHGVLSSSDDGQVYLMLGNGENEAPLGAAALQNILSGIQGEKLLIVDACYSGALIGHGAFAHSLLPGSRAQSPASLETPFLADPSIHVLTSASGFESSWYYDSEGLSTGAVSYFASALSSGLGLYGKPEADVNGNGEVTLEELRRYLNAAVPSSSAQLLSAQANALTLPVATNTPLARALSGFSYGDCLLESDDPTLEFSYTVTAETAVQYRVVRQVNGGWDWQNAATFLDDGDRAGGLLTPGRKTRELTLDGILEDESGYMMLQVFAVTGSEVILCSERLLAVRPASVEPSVTLSAKNAEFDASARRELVLEARINVPAEITVCIYDAQGKLVRRLASAQLTRPAPGDVTRLYWDGRNDAGERVPAGAYAAALETVIGGERQKATVDITVR